MQGEDRMEATPRLALRRIHAPSGWIRSWHTQEPEVSLLNERFKGLRDGLDAGDLSSEALARQALDRMGALDARVDSIASPLSSVACARRADRRLRGGERTPLLGLPFLVKDNLALVGEAMTHGSRIGSMRALASATVVRRLLEAGAVPVARARMDEFAMGSSGEHCASGPSRNPWDTTRVPGGSSSGSAAGLAAGFAAFALGSDTGGSVRLPAAFCGLSALRPTYGVLSRRGLSAMASSLDQIGLMAWSALDLAAILSVTAGVDPEDATSADLPGRERLADLRPLGLRGLRIGLPREAFGEGLAPEVRSLVETAADRLASEGAVPVEVELPHSRFAIDTYYLLNTSEVSSNLARFDGVRFGTRLPGEDLQDTLARTRDEGFGPEVKRRILLGAFCLSKGYYEAFYLRALQARTLIAQDFQRAFQQVDLLLMPVSPTTAFPLGSRLEDPLAMYLADLHTVPQALAGLPALALPAGLANGLPVGFQLVGPAFSDVALLEAGHAFQLLTDHHRCAPPLPA